MYKNVYLLFRIYCAPAGSNQPVLTHLNNQACSVIDRDVPDILNRACI
jgi:hypothetical protein